MNKQTVSLANAHDGVALTAEEAALIALLLELGSPGASYAIQRNAREIRNILRGKRRDGSEPGDPE